MKEKSSGNFFKFLIGAGGIYCTYIYYGLIQEKIFRTDYTEGKSDQKFSYSFAILLFQNLFSALLAGSINRYYYKLKHSAMDLKTELAIGGCNFGTMICANTALSFVSYPVQALMKSSKIISILMVSLLFGLIFPNMTKKKIFSLSIFLRIYHYYRNRCLQLIPRKPQRREGNKPVWVGFIGDFTIM
jgi:hypothetical protein